MSPKKVIYHEFTNKHTRKVIDFLSKHHEWEPVFITGSISKEFKDWCNIKFAECMVQDSMELRQAQFDYSSLGHPVPIDSIIINKLYKYALNYLGFLPDTNGRNFTFQERKLFYYDILKYWNTVLQKLKPDILVCFTRPHTSAEYSLYLLCKYHYQIDVIFINPLPLFDRNDYFIGTSLSKFSEPFVDIYRSENCPVPGETVKKYLDKLRSDKGKTPDYILNVYKSDKRLILLNIKQLVKTVGKTLVKGPGKKLGLYDWKSNKKPYQFLSCRLSIIGYQMFIHKRALNNIKLKYIYKSYVDDFDYSKNYLYFPAPYQPESVTAINGGLYEEVFIVLDILESVLPDNWYIYYKEHPGTFRLYAKGSLKRDKYFYEKLATYKNIKILCPEEDSFKLIDNAKAVASIAGTASWEAAVRGKPALSFGNSWYDECDSIFHIESIKDAEHALDLILKGFSPDKKDIEKYLAAIDSISIKDIVHRNFNEQIMKKNDPDDILKKIANSLKHTHDRIYSNNSSASN